VPLVVCDITYGVHDRDRLIVVREPDGVLREAEWEERDRVNQIYFPKEGRKMETPAMFRSEEKLREILKEEKCEYILDRCCVQFEPDHPAFIKTAEAVYDYLDENKAYKVKIKPTVVNSHCFFSQVLESTRHFGPMCFHLSWLQRCDDLMAYLLKTNEAIKEGDLSRAASLAKLYARLHPQSKVAQALDSSNDLNVRAIF